MDNHSLVSVPSIALMASMAVIALSGAHTAEAYAVGPSPAAHTRFSPSSVRYSPTVIKRSNERGVQRRREDGSAVTLYLFPTPPSVSAANHRRRRPRSGSESDTSTSLPAMSDSVLSSSDILPSFHTAHGLLSPEVVMRIADTHDLEEGDSLHQFLQTYKRKGPMACLPMLSDPCVLPELTKAMRDIA